MANLEINVKVDSRTATQQLSDLNHRIKMLDKDIALANNTIDDFDAQTEGMVESVGSLASKVDLAKQKVKIYEGELLKAKEHSEKLKQEQDELKRAMDNVNREADDGEAKFRELEKALAAKTKQVAHAEKAVVSFERKVESSVKDVDKFSKELDNVKADSFSRNITSIKGNLSGKVGVINNFSKVAAVGFGGALVGATKKAMDFEQQLANIEGITGANAKEMEVYKKSILELGKTTEFTSSDVAEGFAAMGKAGLGASESASLMPATLDLATIAGEELGTVTSSLVDTMNGFGLVSTNTAETQRNAAKAADIFAKASSSANTSVGELGEAMKYVAPVAGTLDYNIAEVSAGLALMAQNGIKGSQAGTSLKTALLRLQNPTETMNTLMAEHGIQLTDSDGKMLGFKDTMDVLRQSFADLDETQQSQIATELFGMEAASGMLGIINAAPEAYDEMMLSIQNADGAAEEMASTMRDTTAMQWDNLMASFEELGISIGTQLLPHVQAFLDKVSEAVEWFGGLDESIQNNILFTGGLALLAVPTITTIGDVVGGIKNISDAIGKVPEAFTALDPTVQAFLGTSTLIIGSFVAMIAATKMFIDFMVLMDQKFEEVQQSEAIHQEAHAVYAGEILTANAGLIDNYDQLKLRTTESLLEMTNSTGAEFIKQKNNALTNASEQNKFILETMKEGHANELAEAKRYVETLHGEDKVAGTLWLEQLRRRQATEYSDQVKHNQNMEENIANAHEEIKAIREKHNITEDEARKVYFANQVTAQEEQDAVLAGLLADANTDHLYVANELKLGLGKIDEETYNNAVKAQQGIKNETVKISGEQSSELLANLVDARAGLTGEYNALADAPVDAFTRAFPGFRDAAGNYTSSMDGVGETSEDMSTDVISNINKINENVDTEPAQKEIGAVEDAMDELRKDPNVAKYINIITTYETRGTPPADNPYDVPKGRKRIFLPSPSTFAPMSPQMQSTITDTGIVGGVVPSTSFVPSQISNYATASSDVNQVLGNIGRTLPNGSVASPIAMEQQSVNREPATFNFNINIDKMNAQNEQDIYELAKKLDKELRRLQQRNNMMTGGVGYVR